MVASYQEHGTGFDSTSLKKNGRVGIGIVEFTKNLPDLQGLLGHFGILTSMDPWFQMDLDAFRSIHLNMHQSWLDGPMRILSDSGLAHLQLAPLLFLLVANSKYRNWAIGVGIVFAITIFAVGYREGRGPEHLLASILILLLCRKCNLASLQCGLLGWTIGGLAHLTFKSFVERERPSMLAEAHPLEHVYLTRSFPSGHTCTACGMAFAFALSLQSVQLRLLMVMWCLGVGFSRIYVGVHWPSDVLAGIGFGLAAGVFANLILSNRVAATGIDSKDEA